LKNHYLDTGIGRFIEIEDKKYLYFSGTSYLGIAQDGDFLDILANNIFEYGGNYGQSRINRIRMQVFDEFEEFFAEEAGADAAAVLSSGYLAGIAAWQSLVPGKDEVWAAPDAHAAILPTGILPNSQLNFTQWKNHCLDQAQALSSREILILGNSVDPFTADIHDYSWVKEIARKHHVSLLIDDSHAFGILGEEIFGTYEQWKDYSYNLLVSGSLGKALGLPAGIILGNDESIAAIKSTPLFGGASPGSPAHLHTFLEMQHTYQAAKTHLRANCEYFARKSADLSQVTGSASFPVFIFSEDSWVEEFEKAGIITSSFPYPTVSSPSVNRIVISAFHELEDIKFLNDILHDLAQK